MLVELAVKNLGVIESARIPFDKGLVALTGETGAGKTMLIDALNLLAGNKADPTRVRMGADEAVVEGFFAVGDDEWVLRRVVPRSGRSKAYLNGELATAATLAEVASGLLEMHGQHAQQQLFSPRAHCQALDEFAGVDTTKLDETRAEIRRLDVQLATMGGDERSRAREIGLLEFQLDEIDSAGIRIGEDAELQAQEDLLADALAHLEASGASGEYLRGEGGAVDAISGALAVLRDRQPFRDVAERLLDLQAELVDVADELRGLSESIEPDPERLDQIQQRRALLLDLRRKYGESEQAVLDFAEETRTRLDELASHDERVKQLENQRVDLTTQLVAEATRVGRSRRGAADKLAAGIEQQLGHLAMPAARMIVSVEDSAEVPGDGASVEFLISTNPGVEPGSLGKVASGGELSRVMLALRLVLTESPPTTVFDEIDAGIGGETAVEVGRLLSALSSGRQVLVVTHLPQVAAFADVQVKIEKSIQGGTAGTTARPLDHDDRLVELSRMISGQPDSASARLHAEELLANAASERGRRAS